MPLHPMGEAYLDLLEQVLTGSLMEDPPILTDGYRALYRDVAKSLNAQTVPDDAEMARYHDAWRERGMDWPSRAWTMVGRKRLRNFRIAIGDVIDTGVAGDILETGVWRGGASILARAVLSAYGDTTRRVIAADSFEGLPPPSGQFAQDADSKLHEHPELAVSLDTVKANFAKFGLLDSQVVFLKGWFRDTMPNAPVEKLSVLRLDGDMYESTIDPLKHLYDKVSIGGWIIVDDYFIPACKAAVTDFLDSRNLKPEIVPIDGMSVYFRKRP